MRLVEGKVCDIASHLRRDLRKERGREKERERERERERDCTVII